MTPTTSSGVEVSRTSSAFALAAGAATGAIAWYVFTKVGGSLPIWLRFAVAGAVLTFGPGAGPTIGLLAPLSWLARLVLACSFGVALAPVLAHVLGSVGLLPVVPYVSAAWAGAAIASWRAHRPPATGRGPLIAVLVLVVIASAIGVAAFAHRVSTTATTTTVHGDYDSYDLTYYAAIASELSHTIPPASPFYSGRMLNHAFYPHVLLAMVHRFGAVPLLDVYFRYAWPCFLVLAVLACFVFVQTIADTRTAWISAVLFGAGSNLAYAAGWFFTRSNWDEMIWSHNFQGAGAEVLLYGNWTPALIAMFAALFALHSSFRTSGLGWPVLAGVTTATTVLSKPWVFAGMAGALCVVVLLSWRDRAVRTRLLLVLASSAVIAAPLLYRAIVLFDDAQVTFTPAFFPIPLRMAERIGLRDWFLDTAGALGLTGSTRTGVAAMLAAPVFLVGSLGFRLVGVPALWRTLRRPASHDPIWRVLAWTIVSLLTASTFIVSVPYHETTQIHQCALFLLALFTGRALASISRPRTRVLATAVVIALAVPAMLQYLYVKWNDAARAAEITRSELTIASMLSGTDPDRTAILHDRPNDPWLLGVVSERRSVLGWAGYVRGSEPRLADVETFFASPDTPTALAILRTCRPTHVVEYEERDHINTEIRDQLELLAHTGGVSLYRVPEKLVGPETGRSARVRDVR